MARPAGLSGKQQSRLTCTERMRGGCRSRRMTISREFGSMKNGQGIGLPRPYQRTFAADLAARRSGQKPGVGFGPPGAATGRSYAQSGNGASGVDDSLREWTWKRGRMNKATDLSSQGLCARMRFDSRHVHLHPGWPLIRAFRSRVWCTRLAHVGGSCWICSCC